MISRLERVKNSIELMTKFHQIEVLRILNASEDVRLNENKNGVFVNLSKVPENLIDNLEEYIKYVNKQETSLKKQETELRVRDGKGVEECPRTMEGKRDRWQEEWSR